MVNPVMSPDQTCRKCGAPMAPGKAIENTLVGIGDFGPADRVVTMSPGGPGRLVDCMKCTACGWSVTAPSEEKPA